MRSYMSRYVCVLLLITLLAPTTVFASLVTIADNGKAVVTIVLPNEAKVYERTAGTELADYLHRITGADFTTVDESAHSTTDPAVYVGATDFARTQMIDTENLSQEQWVIRTCGDSLVLAGGGTRGTLYAVYHFLEDELGVHWWNPFEDHVPQQAAIILHDLNRTGKPVFSHRNMIWPGGDTLEDPFCARNRINTHSFDYIPLTWGGDDEYGHPYLTHNFARYVPSDKFFDKHPEWFSMYRGERQQGRKKSQLCLSNQELRTHMYKKLKSYISRTRKEAAQKGFLPSTVFDISHNDGGAAKMCQCPDCSALTSRYGSETGQMLDFINWIAEKIEPDYPDISVCFLAYNQTEPIPDGITPRDNVVVSLCPTKRYETLPLSHPLNKEMRELYEGWARITTHLRSWDYSANHGKAIGTPTPTVHTYAEDMRYMSTLGIEGIVALHYYELMQDMRDLKVWMWAKLAEDPFQDEHVLLETFTNGFYGPGGTYIRDYLDLIEGAIRHYPICVIAQMEGPMIDESLDYQLLIQAADLFDKAQHAVQDDLVKMQRVHYARLTLDYATLQRWPMLVRHWQQDGYDADEFPLNKHQIADRLWNTIDAEVDRRIREKPYMGSRNKENLRSKYREEIDEMLAAPPQKPLAVPERFTQYVDKGMYDIPAYEMIVLFDVAEVVSDPDAPSGVALRAEFSDEQMEKYRLPMDYGVFEWRYRTSPMNGTITADQIPGPGYHWYKLGRVELTPVMGMYLFWSWYVQAPIGSACDVQRGICPFDIYASIKFEGPGFLDDSPGSSNAVCIERITAIPCDNLSNCAD